VLYIVLATIGKVTECDSITAISNPLSSEDQNLLAIRGTAATCTEIPYDVPAFVSKPSALTQDLRDYFSRERMIATGTFPAAKGFVRSNEVAVASLAAWYPDFLTRLTGVYAIRFTLNFTLRTSPTPFAQGLTCIAFQYASSTSGTFGFHRGDFSFSATQLPHARLNFEDTNEVSLKVPFLYAFDFLSLRDGFSDSVPYGTLSLTNITPVPIPPSASAVTYKLYVHLTDLELIGSTSWVDNTVLLNSGFNTLDTVVKKVGRKVAVADKELKRSKVISSSLADVSNVVQKLANVPLLSGLSGTPTWLINSLKGTAAALGYAAPALEEAYQIKLDRHTLDPLHIDVPIAASKLSPFQTNKLEVSEVLGACDEDAMSLAYVLSKPSQIYMGSMTTAQASNTLIYGTKISPYSFWYRSTGLGNLPAPSSSTASTNVLYPSNIMYIADHFRYWRGGLKFHLTFSKTQFHAGQVLITYIPYAESAGTAGVSNVIRIPESASGLTQPNQFSMIVDLRSGSEVEFDVPFMFPTPYAGVNDSTGALSIVVLNPLLVASTQASTTINFVVEVSAKSDFEFAAVVPPSMATSTTTIGDAFLESGFELPNNTTMAEKEAPAPTIEPCASIIGEKVNSLKQLAMIPAWFAVDQVNATVANFTVPNWSYRPAWTLATPMATTSTNNLAVTHAGKVASMYVFSNGSTRLTVQPQEPGVGMASVVISHKPTPGNQAIGLYTTFASFRNKRLYSNASSLITSTQTSTVDIPWYTKVMRVAHDYYNIFYNPRNFAGSNAVVVHSGIQGESIATVAVRNTSGATRTFHYGLSAGEDATAACFIGPAPVILFNSLATVSPNSSVMYNDA